MKKINSSEIPNWPDEVLLAYCKSTAQVDKSVLTAPEKEEFEAFTNPKRKSEYLIGRALFRFLIKELHLNPNEVQLLKEEKGKPYALFNNSIINVSFSHSSDLVMCAISKNIRIGLDVESQNREINQRVIKRMLNEDEWKVIGLENPLKIWTIKEAALKCSGHGLQTKLKNLNIKKTEKNRFFIRFNDDFNYEICSFNLLGHQIALAYQSNNF